jgi:hypothetical protein
MQLIAAQLTPLAPQPRRADWRGHVSGCIEAIER